LLIHEWNAADTVPEEEFDRLGMKGSPTKVKNIESVVLTVGDTKNVAPTVEGISELIHELISDHTLG